MRRRLRPEGLQQQLLLWSGVVAIALSLLAMHQLSGNHIAADPSPRTATQFDRSAGNVVADAGLLSAAHSAGHAHSAGQPQPGCGRDRPRTVGTGGLSWLC